MALYIEFFKKAFQERYAFRFDFYISILSSILLLIIQLNVWEALYRDKGAINNVAFGEMISYTIVATVVMSLTGSGAGRKIADRIQNGSIIMDFIKPINFKSYLFSEDLGTNIFKMLFISIPSIGVTLFFYRVSVIASIESQILFLASLIIGVLIAFNIHYIFGLFAFWLETSWYIPFFTGAMFELFSGSVVPLWFYPDWLYDISQVLPFRFIFFEPISILLGKYTVSRGLSVIQFQLIWLIAVVLIERFMWFMAQKKIVVHGG